MLYLHTSMLVTSLNEPGNAIIVSMTSVIIKRKDMQSFLWAIQRETKYDLVLNYASKHNIFIQNLFTFLNSLCNNVDEKR